MKLVGEKDKVEEIIKNFKAANAPLCPEGRDDISQPKCYCYNDNHSPNVTGRANSDICRNQWSSTAEFFAGSEYGRTKAATQKGCMNMQGKFDQAGKCKKQIVNAQSKENNCAKVPAPPEQLGPIVGKLAIDDTIRSLNQLSNGIKSPSELALLSGKGSLAKNKKVLDNMIDKINKKNKKEGKQTIPSSNSLIKKYMNSNIVKDIARQISPDSTSPNAFMGSSLPKGISKKSLNKSLGKAGIKSYYSRPTKSTSKKGKQKKKSDFNFDLMGDSGNEAQIIGENEGSEDTRNYNYKNNDIVMREDVSIWDVLSNRYLNSGLKKLFGNEE